jgi:hypothetical protein
MKLLLKLVDCSNELASYDLFQELPLLTVIPINVEDLKEEFGSVPERLTCELRFSDSTPSGNLKS